MKAYSKELRQQHCPFLLDGLNAAGTLRVLL
jgi:hypothetical protein